MPKIQKRYEDYAREAFLREIRKCQGLYNLMNNRALADACGIPYQTLLRRLKCPEDFTLGELKKLQNTIHLDPFVLLSFLNYSTKDIKQLREQWK